MPAMQRFTHVARNPRAYVEEWKSKTGGKVVGHFCSYTPEEIITAAGALPVRIFGDQGGSAAADAHLQAYSCSLVRGGLDDALNGNLDFLDGTVFPHTCDSIQRLSAIWRMNVKDKFHLDISLPVKLNTASARAYMHDTLIRFRFELGNALQVDVSARAIENAVRLHNRIRSGLARLYEFRMKFPQAVSGSDVHTACKAGMIMDRSDFAPELERWIEAMGTTIPENTASKRLVLAGGLCNMPDVYGVIENSGAAVVWDDFCTGARYFEGTVKNSGDIIAHIAARYLDRVVCPAKHSGEYHRGEYLLNLAIEKKADGVIFMLLKFCDPHAFDYPYMQAMLNEAGIPSLLFEVEDQSIADGQLKTRCEAFIEML